MSFPTLSRLSSLLIRLTSAIVHGIGHVVGHVAPGAMADLVLWKPENFGSKPQMILKSGVIAWAQVWVPKIIRSDNTEIATF